MQSESTDLIPFARPNSRASLACVQCRSKHLRCNGTKPKCSRCQRENGECTYLKSRRGIRSRPTVQETQILVISPTQVSPSQNLPATARPDSVESVPPLIPGSSSLGSSISSPSSNDLVIDSRRATNQEPILDLYYTYFHPSHPCVLPKSFIKQRLNDSTYDTTPGVKLLVMVMRFIGSLYAPKVCSSPLEDQVKTELAIRHPYTTGFEVQALILYSVAVYWCADTQRARELLDSATAKALALGMNLRQFAIDHSGGDPVLAESWRRTWWQLYLTDAHFASSTHSTHFGTSQRDVLATVELPCDELDYCSGNIPQPNTMDNYDNREFAIDDEADFSSFAYLIGLMRTLDLISIGIPRNSEENVKLMATNADAGVAAWVLLLSKSKRKLFRDDGTIDELLFKANMVIHIYTVDIHRYLSTLTYSAIESVSTCAPPPPPERLAPVFYRDAHIHTAKILGAIEKITDLLILPGRNITHTPFTICMIATATIAHLSACKNILEGEALQVARERIRVAIGALETFSEVWPRGKEVTREVKIVARELLGLGPSSGVRKPVENPSISTLFVPQVQNSSPLTTMVMSPTDVDLSGCFDFPPLEADTDAAFVCSDWGLRTGFVFDATVGY